MKEMKHIKRLELNESALSDAKRQMKYFHEALNLDVTIKELMNSIDAVKVDLKSMFPTLKGNERMDKIPQDEKFVESLNKLELKLSELNDTENFDTFSRIPMKWYWVYTEDASELEMPVYILYKYYYDGEWSDMKLYYVQDDINNFLDELSLVTIEIRHTKNEEKYRWFYTTSDSGKTWTLQEDKKKIKEGSETKIVQSNKPTGTFKKSMKWDDILNLARNVNTKLIIY